MGNYEFTHDTIIELEDIYSYSILQFGIEQAQKYINGLHHSIMLLADNPRLGRECYFLEDDMARRHEYERHVIYYDITESGILILHILGSSQDPARHLK